MTIQIEMVRPADLRAATYNPRKIAPSALRALAGLMDRHGFVAPVIARRRDRLLIAGHQRLKANALRRCPDEQVPCILLDDVSDWQAKALNVALNNPAAQGRYDIEALAELLGELRAQPPADLPVELTDLPAATGFCRRELDELAASIEELDLQLDAGGDSLDDNPAGLDADGLDAASLDGASFDARSGKTQPAAGPAEASAPAVVLIFELTISQYAAAKADFDHLIAAHHLPCHVRMEDQIPARTA